jgi:hypothetical protein
MQRDAAKSREARLLHRNIVGDGYDEVATGPYGLRMAGTLAAEGHQLAGLEICHGRVHSGNHTRT